MEELLSRLGLDKKEARCFLCLVRLGASTVSAWAKRSGINRSSMYVILTRLQNMGLVSTFTHKGVQYVQALSAAKIPTLLDQRKRELEDTRTLFASRLPELATLEKTQGILPGVQFFEGKTRVAMMYEEVLAETYFCSYFHPARVKAVMPEYYHKIPQMLAKHKGKARELLVSCQEALDYVDAYRSDRHEIRVLSKGIEFSSDTIITREKIYLVSYGKDDIAATEIWNKELAQTQLVLFDLIWSKHVDLATNAEV